MVRPPPEFCHVLTYLLRGRLWSSSFARLVTDTQEGLHFSLSSPEEEFSWELGVPRATFSLSLSSPPVHGLEHSLLLHQLIPCEWSLAGTGLEEPRALSTAFPEQWMEPAPAGIPRRGFYRT